MIPKIIHYCWLSENPMPENIKGYIGTWRKHLPDYEFVLWNFDRFDKKSSVWVKQAFEAGKYAFAADYIRLYALYQYGGIYLDTDVEIVKPFDDLLDLPYFLGKEISDNDCRPEAGIMGAEKGCYWIKKCLDYYENREFITGEGKANIAVPPQLMQNIITQNFGFRTVSNKSEFTVSDEKVCIFPTEFFSPKNYTTSEINKTPNTFSIHHFAGSWLPDSTSPSNNLKKLTLDDLLKDIDVKKLMMPMTATEILKRDCSFIACTSSGGCATSTCTQFGCVDGSNCTDEACIYTSCAGNSNIPSPTVPPGPTGPPCLSLSCITEGCFTYGCSTSGCNSGSCYTVACISYGYTTPIPIPPNTPAPTCKNQACYTEGCYSNSDACIISTVL
jgi:hypothetical protein